MTIAVKDIGIQENQQILVSTSMLILERARKTERVKNALAHGLKLITGLNNNTVSTSF